MLWIPGPTEVRPEIFQELGRPMIGHRSPQMIDFIERIDPGLALAFGLEPGSSSTVAVGNHSATAMMEGSLIGAGERVLAIVGGAFAKRWRDIAQTLGKHVSTLDVEWGCAVTGEALETVLREQGPFDAVTLVLNETSTGVLTPLAPVAEALAGHGETLLLVDVVSAIAGAPIDFDKNRIDFALAGVQKALALPPGICVMCASERYLDAARARERKAWYLDPLRTIDGHVARKTPTTPCIPLYAALARQLEDISSGVTLPGADRQLEGAAAWTARFAKHSRMQARTHAWAATHGLSPFPVPEVASTTVSCLNAEGIDAGALIKGLAARGEIIGGGYGPLKGKTFRIGHMGDHTEDNLERLLTSADEVLAG